LSVAAIACHIGSPWPAANAAPIAGPLYDSAINEYLYITALGSWTQAESAAQSFGGNLLTIHNVTENQFVVNNVLQNATSNGGPNLSNVPLWLGLYDPIGAVHDDGPGGPSSQHAANFVWIDGSTAAYRNWNTGTGEPNDSAPGEYYTTINWHEAQTGGPIGTWNDAPLNGTVGYGGTSNGPYYGIAATATILNPGDVNYDGIVNAQDIAVVASHWLNTGSFVPGDANGDRIVNAQDIAEIASNWLHTGSGGGPGAAVPEPSTLILAALGGLALLAWRWLGSVKSRG